MDFKLNGEQQMLQDSIRRYIEKSYTFDMRLVRMRGAAADDPWQTYADNGWLAAALPEAYGGLGGHPIDTAIISQELGRGLVLEPHLGCAVMAAQTLVAAGTSAQKERVLPSLADGSTRIALAYSEPDSHGMSLPVETGFRAEADGYRLSGRKSLVLSGGDAQRYIVSARLDGAQEDEITLLLVDAAAPGVTRQTVVLHDGTRAEELVFEQVWVEAGAVLGEVGRGMPALQTGLQHGVIALCAELVGGMEKVIEVTADYLKTRKQFGVPIGSFQALQHRMADMAAEMEVARSMLYAALASFECDDVTGRQPIISAAKALIGRAAKSVCGQGIQLHGGIGMTEEYVVGHHFKRAVVAGLQLGTVDRHEWASMA